MYNFITNHIALAAAIGTIIWIIGFMILKRLYREPKGFEGYIHNPAQESILRIHDIGVSKLTREMSQRMQEAMVTSQDFAYLKLIEKQINEYPLEPPYGIYMKSLKNNSKTPLPPHTETPGALYFSIDDNGPDEITVYNRAGQHHILRGYETSRGIDIESLQAPNVASK